MRTRTIESRAGRGGLAGFGATLLAVAIPAATWGLLAGSAWVAVMTFVLCGLPVAWAGSRRVPFWPWLAFGFLAGGTITAAALLTGHAHAP